VLRFPPNLAGEKLGCQRGVDSAQQPTRKRKGDVASDKLTLIVFFVFFLLDWKANFWGIRRKMGLFLGFSLKPKDFELSVDSQGQYKCS